MCTALVFLLIPIIQAPYAVVRLGGKEQLAISAFRIQDVLKQRIREAAPRLSSAIATLEITILFVVSMIELDEDQMRERILIEAA